MHTWPMAIGRAGNSWPNRSQPSPCLILAPSTPFIGGTKTPAEIIVTLLYQSGDWICSTKTRFRDQVRCLGLA
jgi:hypothetical protein